MRTVRSVFYWTKGSESVGWQNLKFGQEKDFYIFYLVTKVFCHQKPTLQSLATTLVQLKDRIKELSIYSLIRYTKVGLYLRWFK